MAYFVVFRFKPQYFYRYLESDSYEANDHGFVYVFLQMLIDTIETFVFSLVPFPWPWGIYLCSVEWIAQMLRLNNCGSKISSKEAYEWVVPTAYLSLLFLYLGVLMLSSVTFERSAVESYRNNRRQKRDADEKRKLVDLLVSDVKVPLQYLLHGVNNLEVSSLYKNERVKQLSASIAWNADLVNNMADDLLLLVRIAENRFIFRCNHTVNRLSECLKSLLEESAGTGLTTNYSKVFSSIRTQLPPQSFVTDKLCLNVLLKYFIFFAAKFAAHCTAKKLDLRNVIFAATVEWEAVGLYQKVLNRHNTNRKHVLKIRVTNSDKSVPDKDCLVMQDPSVKAAVLICKKVTSSIDGEFKATHNTFEVSIKCVLAAQQAPKSMNMHSLRSNPNSSHHHSNNNSHHRSGHSTFSPRPEHVIVEVTAAQEEDSEGEEGDVVVIGQVEHLNVGAGEATPQESAALASKRKSSLSNLRRFNSSFNQRSRQNSAYSSNSSDISGSRHSLVQDLGNSFRRASTIGVAKPVLLKACLNIDDAVLSTLVADILRRTGYFEENIPVLRGEVAARDIQGCFLVLASTIETCRKLRVEHEFTGLVVLFSGILSYLDESDMALLSWLLPLPCMERDLKQFGKWLDQSVMDMRLMLEEVTAPPAGVGENNNRQSQKIASRPALSTRLRRRFERLISSHEYLVYTYLICVYFYRFVRDGLRKARDFVLYLIFRTDCGIIPLPPRSHESYAKWRLLNPDGVTFHHTNVIQAKHTLVMMRYISGAFVRGLAVGRSTAGGLLVLVLVMQSVNSLYKRILKPLRIKMSTFWVAATCLVLVMNIIATCNLMWQFPPPFVIFSNSDQSINAVHHCESNVTTSMFVAMNGTAVECVKETLLTKQFGGFSGPFVMYTAMNGNNLFVSYIVYFTWPWVNVLFFSNAFRMIVTLFLLRELFPVQVTFQIALLNVILLLVLVFAIQLFYENTYRREFIELRENVFNKIFLDHCLRICLQDMYVPLQRLVKFKQNLLYVIQDVTIECQVTIKPSLLHRFQPLHMSELLLNELIYELEYSHLELRRKLDVVIKLNDVVLLEEFLVALTSSFSSSTEGLELKVFFEVDKQLSVVRCNKLLLTTLITNTVTLALRNIKRHIRDHPGRKDVVNEILVRMTPLKADKPERFADVRLMMVNILDTSRPTETLSAHRRRHDSESNTVSEEREEADEDDEDETAYYNGHSSNVNTTSFGQNVCYKMATQAAPENRVAILETGFLNHAHYGGYQRFTIPYKLTSDSAKASDYLKDRMEGFQLVESRSSELLREYNKTRQIHEALGTSISQVSNLTNASVKLTYLQAAQLKLNNLTRSVLFYGSKNPERMAEFSKHSEAFESKGWRCKTLYPFSCVPTYGNLQEQADCILVDNSLKDVPGGVSVHDLIVQLRVCGYRHTVALLFDTTEEAQLHSLNHKDVSAPDVPIVRPFTSSHVEELAVACDVRTISQLLQTEGYDYKNKRQ
eukprot:gene29325-36357_t